ncbi:MAG: SMP-30/gluconolactonase/LRE family protein [Verrucomicrobiales bacterium]|nr:SMP-30/gluconolactonase/LRE family protein [Verrucomicrobiales bacterium]
MLEQKGFTLVLFSALVLALAMATTAWAQTSPGSIAPMPSPSPTVLPPLPPMSTDLRKLIVAGATVEKVAGGFVFTEGPVWHPSGQLFFSDLRGNKTYTWNPKAGATLFPGPNNRANGLAFDPQGRLVYCEHGGRRVSRMEKGGHIATVVDRYQGKRLNSPNDLVITPDGSIYFTDIRHNLPQGEAREIDLSGVYRLRSNGELQLIDNEMDSPNGIAFSPDRKTLYVADTRKQQLWAFAVAADGNASHKRLFAEWEPGVLNRPDGLKTDVKGNIYVAVVETGVWVFNKNGRHLGVIPVPEKPANVAFGDADLRTLYITASTGLYRIRLKNRGWVASK